MAEIFDMGEYASFVWAGWGLSAFALAGLSLFAILERRRAKARLKRAQERAGQAS